MTTSTVTTTTMTISTVTITSSPNIRVSANVCLVLLIMQRLQNHALIVKGSYSKETTPSTSQQEAEREATNVTYMILALVFLVVAILLVITNIALGIMLCHSRKTVKSVLGSKLTPHKSKFATPCNDYIHIYI